jgi:hypothetical protein
VGDAFAEILRSEAPAHFFQGVVLGLAENLFITRSERGETVVGSSRAKCWRTRE